MEKTTEKKLTKVEKFGMIKALPAVAENPMLVEFIDHEIELLSKKNGSSKKPTKTQVANEGIKDTIYNGMTEGEWYSVTDIQKNVEGCEEFSNQKLSALLRAMKDEHKVERKEEKRKAYFRKVVVETTTEGEEEVAEG